MFFPLSYSLHPNKALVMGLLKLTTQFSKRNHGHSNLYLAKSLSNAMKINLVDENNVGQKKHKMRVSIKTRKKKVLVEMADSWGLPVHFCLFVHVGLLVARLDLVLWSNVGMLQLVFFFFLFSYRHFH